MKTIPTTLRSLLFLGLVAALLIPTPSLRAGGQLETFDFTGMPPGPVPGTVSVGVTPIQWDPRCAAVRYAFNEAVLPVTLPPIDQAATVALMQTAFDAWNDIPTSYIDFQITDSVVRPSTGPFTFASFDFVNEVNFLPGLGEPTAASPSVSFTSDVTLAPGADVDGDGDSDVFDPAVEGIEVCADVDGDGDTEFPAGFYRAGTILENDIGFNNASVTWTTGAPDSVFGQLDLLGVATHEFGHSHGLSHSAINQFGEGDGTTPTMVNGVSSGDAASELGLRSPSSDDIAWSSYVYPEGSADEGLAALQPGDVAFDDAYGVIRGEVAHGELGLPLAGSSVFAVDEDTGRVVSSHYTGSVRFAFSPATGLQVLPDRPDFHIADGKYTLPVPVGRYNLAVEALDGAPFSFFIIGPTTQVAGSFGLQNFNEQFFPKGDPLKKFKPLRVKVRGGEEVTGVDHTTSVDVNVDPFDLVGANPFIDFNALGEATAPPGRIYAVYFPAEELTTLIDEQLIFKGAAFRNFHVDGAEAIVFARAALVPGRVDGASAELELASPLEEQAGFLGQENEFSPLYFRKPLQLTRKIEREIQHGAEGFFLILELPDAFPGASGLPPFMGFDFGTEIGGPLGRSFVSDDGGASFVQNPNVNFMFRLIGELDC